MALPPATHARRLALVAALACAAAAAALPTSAASAAGGPLLSFHFDHGESLRAGSAVVDASGHGNDGQVQSGFGGVLAPVVGWAGTTSAQYPASCTGATCPKAMIRVASSASLTLGYADVEWGTRLRLSAGQTSKGENLVQKGLYGDRDGQWKLQVDGKAGRPSCVVSGSHADGSRQQVIVLASTSVADGTWHQVTCRRTSTAVTLLIDGVRRGTAQMRPVDLTGNAPVAIGGKQVIDQDNDQFDGALDDVFVRRI